MQEPEYLHMYEQEGLHWWYAGMRAITGSILPPGSLPTIPRVLDVGCGTGYNLGWLRRQYGAAVTGIDFSPHALGFCRRRGEGGLIRADAVLLPLSGNVYDLVVCLDVLTHMKDAPARSRALREFMRVLRPGGRLLLRVPAYRFLRSGHDDAVMAYHRYGRKELAVAVAAAGFRIRRLTGANTILFPLAVFWRFLKKAGLASKGSDVRPTTRGKDSLNSGLTSVLRLEAALLRRFSFPFGLSFVLLGEKPADPFN